MNILSVQGLTKAHGIKQLFSDVSFGLEENGRAALIGPNGCGKTTLLRILAQLDPPDAGRVVLSQGIRVRYLPQHPEVRPDRTILEYLFEGGSPAAQLVRQYEALHLKMERGESDSATVAEFEAVCRRMDAADAWQYETRARAILNVLGLKDVEAPMESLSGGFRRRAALARVLVEQPELLILDEPTNHLDVELIDWLEDYLRRYPGAVLLVTHDRYFLDRVVNQILEIDRGRITRFDGNFENYLERKAEMAVADAAQRRRLNSMLRQDRAWAQRGARARRTKERKRYDKIGERESRLADLDARRPAEGPAFEVETRRLGNKIVEMRHVAIALGGRPILRDFSYVFTPGERLGVIGPNGSGKSTLANLIAGRLAPDQGEIEVGETVKFGYFTQEGAELPLEERVIDFIKREGGEMLARPGGGFKTAESMLEDFFFPAQAQYAPIGKLSGGERRRLHLVRVLMRDPNFLIFDEPTNDLDLLTLQALEEFLDGFEGCLIVISHDRWFLDRNVDHLFVFELPRDGDEGPPAVIRFEGNYSQWREECAAGSLRESREETKSRPAKTKSAAVGSATESAAAPGAKDKKPARLSYMERRELEELEKRTIEMEERLGLLDEQMTACATDYEKLSDLARRREELVAAIRSATSRWEELAERA